MGQPEYMGEDEARLLFQADLCATGTTNLVTRAEEVLLRWTAGAGWLFVRADVLTGGWQCAPCGQTMAYNLGAEASENYCR